GRGLRENDRQRRGCGKIRRNGSFRLESLVPSWGSFFLSGLSRTAFPFRTLRCVSRRKQSRAPPHHSAIRPSISAKENFALTRIAVKPARVEPQMFGEISRGPCRRAFDVLAKELFRIARMAGDRHEGEFEWLRDFPGAHFVHGD